VRGYDAGMPPRGRRSEPDLTLLYDGDCAFCSWTVRQLRPMDRRGRLRFVPLQLAEDPTRRPRLADLTRGLPLRARLHAVDEKDRITTGGATLLEILARLPGGWLLRPWALVPGVGWLAERAYDLAADNRELLARLVHAEQGWSCRLPAPEGRPASAVTWL